MKNVELIVQMLREAGVKHAFGVPSGPVLPLIEAFRTGGIEYVLTANETSAGFMASATGALTGVPGVAVSTLGPGATNLASGIGAAWLDCAPAIAMTCTVPTPWLNRRIQMRIDHEALFAPLTKRSFGLREGTVARDVAAAITLARSETPGPVHLDLPEDVGTATATESPIAPEAVTSLPSIEDEAFVALGEALGRSKRPLLVTGLGLTRAKDPHALTRFVEAQGMPFVLTLHAKGFLPESHPNYAGVLGRARRSDVQALIDRADLIVAVGYDEIEINYEEWAGAKPVYHLSNRLAENSEQVNLQLNRAGDLDAAIASLSALPVTAHDWTTPELESHRTQLDSNLRPADAPFSAHHVLDALHATLGGDDILAYDVGAHTHQIATQWRTDVPNTCISTNGWSSMGYGIPAAYAAKLAFPDRRVVGVVGDGCFQMTAGEVALGKRLNLNVPIVVLNDGWLGLLKVKQERKDYPLSGVNLGVVPESPAHYFGVPVRSARNESELHTAIEWAFSLNGPSIIEAFTDVSEYSETVYD